MPIDVMLSCTEGYIDVVYANWGRTQLITDVCPSSPPANTNRNCYNSAMHLFSDCRGQRRCEVDVTAPANDNCPTEPKYMQVMYLCQGRYWTHFAKPWLRQGMDTLLASLAFCTGNSQIAFHRPLNCFVLCVSPKHIWTNKDKASNYYATCCWLENPPFPREWVSRGENVSMSWRNRMNRDWSGKV